MVYDIVNDSRKFKKLDCDKTKIRESRLQRFLLKLKKKEFFNDVEYTKVYPQGSSNGTDIGVTKII